MARLSNPIKFYIVSENIPIFVRVSNKRQLCAYGAFVCKSQLKINSRILFSAFLFHSSFLRWRLRWRTARGDAEAIRPSMNRAAAWQRIDKYIALIDCCYWRYKWNTHSAQLRAWFREQLGRYIRWRPASSHFGAFIFVFFLFFSCRWNNIIKCSVKRILRCLSTPRPLHIRKCDPIDLVRPYRRLATGKVRTTIMIKIWPPAVNGREHYHHFP